MQRPRRRRNELPLWDGASVSAPPWGECDREPGDSSPSPPIFGGRPALQDHLMTPLFPEHHSEPGTGPGREARGRTRKRTSGAKLRGQLGSGVTYSWGSQRDLIHGILFMGEEIWEGFREETFGP